MLSPLLQIICAIVLIIDQIGKVHFNYFKRALCNFEFSVAKQLYQWLFLSVMLISSRFFLYHKYTLNSSHLLKI